MTTSANQPETATSTPPALTPHVSRRGGVLVGALAGLVGIACCVTPAALALLGLSSASFAIALGNTLYGEYGWYFRLAGTVFALAGVVLLLRRRRACSMQGARREWRLILTVVITTLVVYIVLYWLTTWLAWLAAGMTSKSSTN